MSQLPQYDPVVAFGVMVALLTVATVASTLPGWRAARTPPSIVLRAE